MVASAQLAVHLVNLVTGQYLETDVINLAVVIGILVSFGGDALHSLLKNCKQTIFLSLQEADSRAEVHPAAKSMLLHSFTCYLQQVISL